MRRAGLVVIVDRVDDGMPAQAAALLLVEQAMTAPALELLAGAMLARAAAAAGRQAAPEAAHALVWLFGEALPKGFVTTEVANAIMRAQGLAQSAEVPEVLTRAILDEGRAFVLA